MPIAEMCGEHFGEPNPSGAGFPEASEYWCVPGDSLKEMFNGKKLGGSNNSAAFSSALNGLKRRDMLQTNERLVWQPTEEGKCSKAERGL